MLRPLRFGPAGRQCFGLLQLPSAPDAQGRGALLCNPFGQEAIRCHRLMRVLGDRLARMGFAVLRFDYFGTGDADGDDAQGDLESCIADVIAADGELARLSGCVRRSWFGLRTGGTLAALASARAAQPPASLVLWDPVTDGRGYLAELRLAHETALRQGAAGLATTYRLSKPGACPPEPGDELLGFPVPARLREQFLSLDAACLGQARAGSVHLITAQEPDAGAPAPAGEDRARIRGHAIPARIAWANDEAMNSAIVPAEALQAIVDCLAEPS